MGQLMSEQQLAICRLMGTSPEDYLKTKRQETEAAVNREGSFYRGLVSEEQAAICQQLGVSTEDYLVERLREQGVALNSQTSLIEMTPEGYQKPGQTSSGCFSEFSENLDPAAIEVAKKEVMKMMDISASEAQKMIAEMKRFTEAQRPLTDEEKKACVDMGISPTEYYLTRREKLGYPLYCDPYC